MIRRHININDMFLEADSLINKGQIGEGQNACWKLL